MRYILDTCVLSEPTKKAPNPGVLSWFAEHEADFLIPSISIMEMQYGVSRMPDCERKTKIQGYVKKIVELWEDIIVPFDAAVAVHAGLLKAQAASAGIPLEIEDIIIAACALETGAVLVTRNEKHFKQVAQLPCVAGNLRIESPYTDDI